ncbi:MAG: hypothetical protein NTZ61_09875, partial [Proteobacteria bacterium]|nr:hypothetical protein [Pseudomonadota bacterium]
MKWRSTPTEAAVSSVSIPVPHETPSDVSEPAHRRHHQRLDEELRNDVARTRADGDAQADLAAPLVHRVEHHRQHADATDAERRHGEDQQETLVLVEREAVQHLQTAPAHHRLVVVARDADAVGEDRAHFALRVRDLAAVAHPVDDVRNHRLVGPEAREQRLHRRERRPDLFVDQHAVLVQLEPDRREQTDHLERFALDADPGADAFARSQQQAPHFVAEQHHAAAVLDVAVRDAATGGERHATDLDRLGVHAAQIGDARAATVGRGADLPE